MLSCHSKQLLLHEAHLDQVNVDDGEDNQQNDLVDQVDNGVSFFAENEQIAPIARHLETNDADEEDDIDDGQNLV